MKRRVIQPDGKAVLSLFFFLLMNLQGLHREMRPLPFHAVDSE